VKFPKNLLSALFAALGPWAPFWIALADSSFVPLAQAVDVMVVAQAILHPQQAYSTAAMAVAGSTLGCIAAYLAARRGGPRVLERFVSPARWQALQRSFARHGAWHLVVQTMVPLPLPMRLSLVGAGVFRMHPLRFVAAVLFARAVRYFGLALATLAFGENAILFWKERAGLFAGLFLAGVALWLVWKAMASSRAKARSGRGLRAARSETCLEQSALHADEQASEKLVEAPAERVPAHPAAPARVAHGDQRPRLGRPPHPCPPDSGTPLQSGLHLLQRI
jgi:membrane protein YqaA with SNARE-associated domain